MSEHHRLLRLVAAFALALALVGLSAPTARAASFTVTSTADSGAGSLRQAITDAASGDTITFNLPNPSTITLASGLGISKNLTITGPGASQLTISGNNAVRVFQVDAGSTLNLSNITVANGSVFDGGAAIKNEGTLTISSSTFTNNTSQRFGGAILSLRATLSVSNSTFSNNSAGDSISGAIAVTYGSATITNSTFTNNSASTGGAMENFQGTVTISGSTFTNNHATASGGAIANFEGTMTISGSTFTGNTAGSDGGGVIDFDSTLTISGSTFNGNTAGSDGGGIYSSSGNNLSLSSTTLIGNRPGGNCGGAIGIGNDDGSNRTDDRTCDFFSVPNVIELSQSSVAESQPVGTTVGILSTDAFGGTYTYALVSGAGDTDNGRFTISSRTLKTAAVFDYEEKNSYSIRVQVKESLGLTVEKNFTIGVNDVVENVAPSATNDSYSTNEDTPLTVAAPGVLANDTDGDGNTLTASKVSDPAHGTLTLNADGSFTYTPDAGYNGPDSFTYKANDGTVDSNSATVSIRVDPVNDAPTATADSYSTDEDTPLTISAPGLLGNDGDPEGDALTAVLVSGPAHGTLTLNANGSFSYAPEANYNGTDSFTYKANDGAVNSGEATVNIAVNAVNDAPSATGDSYSTDEDTPLTISAPGVLANDSDPDGDALTAVLVSGPAHGTLTLNANGSFTYTPAADYDGPDSFSYKANDGRLESSVVTVSIAVNTVNDAPSIAVAAGGACLADFKGRANLTVGDSETAAGSLTLSASSSNTTLVPVGNISFGGSGAARTVTIATASGKSGSATITIAVSDGAASTTTTITIVAGGSGGDNLTGSAGADMLFGGNGVDTLTGGSGIDLLCGGNGDDTLKGGNGDDTLDAGSGNDRLYGEDGADTLKGGSGNDTLDGGANNDQLYGEGGDDTLTGGSGADRLDGGPNKDRATDFSSSQGDTQANIP